MEYRSSKDQKILQDRPFGKVLMGQPLVLDSASLDPLDTDTDDQYLIPAGTPCAPVTAQDARYRPIKRSIVASIAVNANTVITLDDSSPFRVADVVKQWDVDDGYSESAVGTIASLDHTANTITITGDVSGDVAADDIIGVDYNAADVVLLEHGVGMKDPNGNLVHVPAAGVVCGQIHWRDVNQVGDLSDELLAQDMPLMSFLSIEPGTRSMTDVGTVTPGELSAGCLENICLQDFVRGDLTAAPSTRDLGFGSRVGAITEAGFSLQECGADGTDALALEMDVKIGATSIFTTKPKLLHTAANGADTFTAGTGVTVGVLDATKVAIADGDQVSVEWTLTRTTPETEAADLTAIVNIASKVGA